MTLQPLPARCTTLAVGTAGLAASLGLALIAPHLCPAWLALIVFAVVRQISDTEVRLLGNLVLQVKPRALLGALDEQHKVCRLNWPLASAYSFQPLTVAL